jgi:hypothetical protein
MFGLPLADTHLLALPLSPNRHGEVTDLDGDDQPELLVILYPEVPVGGHAVLSVQPLERGE